MKTVSKNTLNESVQYLKSVGPKRAESFSKIGIRNIRDLLLYFPSRHLDRTTVLTASKAYGYLKNGYDGELTVIGKVFEKEKRRFGRKEIFKVQFRDSTGFFECVWFHSAKYFYSVFNEGDIFAISSKPESSKHGNLQFIHPDFDRLTDDEEKNFLNTGKIIPFYKIPKELKQTNIGDLSLRKIIHLAVENYIELMDETLPLNLIAEHKLANIKDAIRNYHFPVNHELLLQAKTRFKFEELFYMEVLVALRKNNFKSKLIGNEMKISTSLVSDFLKILPFRLTKDQLKVLTEIKTDMLSVKPMNRLLQGDVGSGKTIVALISMLIAVDNGFQAVLMAPTEILADQHFKNISMLMKKLSGIHKKRVVKVSVLLGGQQKSTRERNLTEIEIQEADIIIGTHALFEEKVNYKNIGLVVIDEQHRFGVRQRARLQSKGKTTDVLVMSATPIPRTLTMTVYGDLDLSVINELPADRIPVKTVLRGENKLPEVYKFIFDKCKEGYQAFIVYPLVEDSEKLELKAAETYFKELKDNAFKEIKLGLIHGRMKWQEKEEIMYLFLNKKFDVLVATTVIEVGIDIPDANIIVINDSHRFGLSQLHQLRGRVGRGNKQAYCILITNDKIASIKSREKLNLDYISAEQVTKYKSAIRLQTMVKSNNGFEISEVDLKLRGPGDIFGIQQAGFPNLKHADLVSDIDLLIQAKNNAFRLIQNDPGLLSEDGEVVRKHLLLHYSESLKYAKIA